MSAANACRAMKGVASMEPKSVRRLTLRENGEVERAKPGVAMLIVSSRLFLSLARLLGPRCDVSRHAFLGARFDAQAAAGRPIAIEPPDE
jgi:hypothetical protein